MALTSALAAWLWIPPRAAEARCDVALDGEPAVVERVRAELAAFPAPSGDAMACVAVMVVCRAIGERLAVELRDELGRSARRDFASATGAAAFVVSWARRPLPSVRAAASPAAPQASLASPPAPLEARAPVSAAPRPRRWIPELALAYVRLPLDEPGVWTAVTASATRRHGSWRYGGAIRALFGAQYDSWQNEYVEHLAGEAHGLVAVVDRWFDRIPVRAEAVLGYGAIGEVTGDPRLLSRARGGVRGGLRVAAGVSLGRGVDLELGVGAAALLQRTAPTPWGGGAAELLYLPHVDLGLRWAP